MMNIAIPGVILLEPPRFMTEGQLRAHFGLSERALLRLRLLPGFPPRYSLIGKTDRRAVDAFFDRRAGISQQQHYEAQDGAEDWSEIDRLNRIRGKRPGAS